jgi:tripeptide aminopeptidase
MTVVERFLKYVSFDTQSDEDSVTVPSSAKQKVLGAELAAELSQMGLHGVRMDEYGYVYGWLPAHAGCEGVPCLGLMRHMDTSPDAPGAHVQARIVRYEGGVLLQNAEQGISMSPGVREPAQLCGAGSDRHRRHHPAGADDKAGVAEIFYRPGVPDRPPGAASWPHRRMHHP